MNINLSKKCGIYKIINTFNNRFYVGSSVNLGNRRNSHFAQLKRCEHNNQHLQNAYNKYGKENFKFKVVEFIDKTKFKDKNELKYYVLEREQFWIDSTNCIDKNIGYNLMAKAVIGSIGVKPSKDTRKKLSEANKGKACPEHVKKKLSEDRKGKPLHKNTREACCKKVIDLNTNIVYNTVKKASEATGFSAPTISGSCKGKAGRLAKCNFAFIKKDGSYEDLKHEKKSQGRKIINLTTNKIYTNITQASEKLNISTSCINSCANGKASQASGFNWAYLNKNNKPIIKDFKITKGRKVINLDTGLKFETCAEASRYYGNIQKSKIGECCAGRRKTSGGYRWAYLDDNNNPIYINYEYIPSKKRKLKPEDKRINLKKKVININTGIIYESVSEAGRAYNAKSTTRIHDCCKGKANTAFGCQWKYYEES